MTPPERVSLTQDGSVSISDRPIVAGLFNPVDEAAFDQRRDNCSRGLFGCLALARDNQIRGLGRLIRLIDASEILDLACNGFFVEALWIARYAFGDRRIDEYFDEFAVIEQVAHKLPLSPERRDERAQNNQPRLDHELGHFADAPDVLDPVNLGESEVLVQPMPDIVAIEQDSVDAMRVKPCFDQIGDGRFTRAGEAGEPKRSRSVVIQPGAVDLGDI